MKRLVSNQFGQLARTYWQPLVLSLLSLLAFSQIIAWGVSAVELRKVDSLIAETEKTESAPDPQHAESGKPGAPKPGTPDKPDKKEQKKPAKNIFKKERTNYQLTGIYLDKAVINGNPVAVGQNVGKAKLKEIGIDSVVIEEENGETKTVPLFQGGGGGSGPAPSSNRPPNRPSSRNTGSRRSETSTRSSRQVGSPSAPPTKAFFQGMTEDQIRKMPPEERRKRFNSLSESEKEQLKALRQSRRR